MLWGCGNESHLYISSNFVVRLTHHTRVRHICVNKPGHYLNHWWLIVLWTLRNQTSMKLELKYNTFHWKIISKHRLKNVNHFVPAQCVQVNLKQQPIWYHIFSYTCSCRRSRGCGGWNRNQEQVSISEKYCMCTIVFAFMILMWTRHHCGWLILGCNECCRSDSFQSFQLRLSFHYDDMSARYDPQRLVYSIRSGAVKTRHNIIWYCLHHCSNCNRIYVRVWVHERHPIPRPNGWAMGCLLWEFGRNLTVLYKTPHCIHTNSICHNRR